ncbi:hypothetical protein RCH09_002335 [Actimicrobium sp. GrIS 1.19]|uniref:hypothetical protein n=1 Tax=Actimicrobium sp. GrIS 1.19 TaxID=3071708 RepID=UPI002E01F8B4|nr:hypothetical protein [Actimicrobium sp. GrIS 1.19]
MTNPFKTSPIERALIASTAPPRAHAFGKSINHVRPFIGSALQNFTLAAPALLLVAVIFLVMAVNQTSNFVLAFTRDSKTAEATRIAPVIDKKPLLEADYQSAAAVIAKNNPAVQVALSRNHQSLQIGIKDPALLPEFIYALVTMQSYRAGVAWSADTICLNKCDGGNAAWADISGYTQAISLAGSRAR